MHKGITMYKKSSGFSGNRIFCFFYTHRSALVEIEKGLPEKAALFQFINVCLLIFPRYSFFSSFYDVFCTQAIFGQ